MVAYEQREADEKQADTDRQPSGDKGIWNAESHRTVQQKSDEPSREDDRRRIEPQFPVQ